MILIKTTTKKIVENSIECLNCGYSVYSTVKSETVFCKCGLVGVSGGLEKLIRVFPDTTKPNGAFIDTTKFEGEK